MEIYEAACISLTTASNCMHYVEGETSLPGTKATCLVVPVTLTPFISTPVSATSVLAASTDSTKELTFIGSTLGGEGSNAIW